MKLSIKRLSWFVLLVAVVGGCSIEIQPTELYTVIDNKNLCDNGTARYTFWVGKRRGAPVPPLFVQPHIRYLKKHAPQARDRGMATIEAKGTKRVITHTKLSQATVAQHEKDFGCTSSVAIAREYQINGKSGGESALLKETAGRLPLLTVPAIAKMLRLQQHRPFTYDKVATILKTWKHPDELEDFIEQTWRELPEMGLMRLILEVAHDKMEKHEENFPDPGMLVDDPRLSKRKIKKEEIRHILEALAVTTRMVVIKDQNTYEFSVTAPVETILDAMTRAAKEEVPANPKAGSTKKK